ncbi:MAG: DUF3293 domain-containing protein [Bacteroidota bacterium]
MAKMTELEALYRATTYRVFLPGGLCDLRLDQPSAALRAWLETAGCGEFAIITAANPGSQPRSAADNAEQQARLECELIEGNYEPYAGENVADDGSWPLEESCFIPDIALEDACALGEEFGQKAIVHGGADGVPKLVWIAQQ